MEVHDPLAEADAILHAHEGKVAGALQTVTQQFAVLQNRNQSLLTLCALTLTITGFSGPRIAESGPGARWAMIFGIALVLAGLILLEAEEPRQGLARLISYRNRKTSWYRWQLGCIVLGLSGYVAAVIHYLIG